MLPNIFSATTIPYLQEAVGFAQARHSVLAGNIANHDTPGYRTRDLSPEVFQQRLKQLMESQQSHGSPSGSLGLGVERPAGLLADEADEALRQVREASRSILYHDDSDVGFEQQVLSLSNNQLTHNMAISIMNSQFRLLQTAISERV
jgi:flagellar basal-body rod protein FlgB